MVQLFFFEAFFLNVFCLLYFNENTSCNHFTYIYIYIVAWDVFLGNIKKCQVNNENYQKSNVTYTIFFKTVGLAIKIYFIFFQAKTHCKHSKFGIIFILVLEVSILSIQSSNFKIVVNLILSSITVINLLLTP